MRKSVVISFRAFPPLSLFPFSGEESIIFSVPPPPPTSLQSLAKVALLLLFLLHSLCFYDMSPSSPFYPLLLLLLPKMASEQAKNRPQTEKMEQPVVQNVPRHTRGYTSLQTQFSSAPSKILIFFLEPQTFKKYCYNILVTLGMVLHPHIFRASQPASQPISSSCSSLPPSEYVFMRPSLSRALARGTYFPQPKKGTPLYSTLKLDFLVECFLPSPLPPRNP